MDNFKEKKLTYKGIIWKSKQSNSYKIGIDPYKKQSLFKRIINKLKFWK